jgi:hypothetical protein
MKRDEWYAARRMARSILRRAEKTGYFLQMLGFIERRYGPLVKSSLAYGPEETYVVHAGNFARCRAPRPKTTLKWRTVSDYRWGTK